MKRFIICLATVWAVFGVSSCTETKKPRARVNAGNEAVGAQEVSNVVYTKYGIPLPVDLFTYLVAEEIPYNNDLLVPLENMEKYTKETKQAMALGVYSADIAYCSLYKKQQEVMGYFNCSFKLADKLDISEGFNFRYVERMENNVNSADSLSKIAAESYWKACNYLNDNDKNNILPFVIYGGWIESQYLTVASNDQKNTRTQILNQREGLLSLINYLYEVMIESSAFYYNYDIKTIIFNLNSIKKIYDKVDNDDFEVHYYNEICQKIKKMRADLIDPRIN